MMYPRFLAKPHGAGAGRVLLTVGSTVVVAALACGGGGTGAATETAPVDLAATSVALQSTVEALAQSQTQQAQAPPTPILLPTAPAQPTQPLSGGGVSVFDDFSSDFGSFEIFDGAQISNGEFYLGAFADCGDLQASTPYGCLSVCLTCGIASDYIMSADVRYVDGVSERTYGLILQFTDVNDNSVVDQEDYYLEYQVSAFVAFYTDNLYLREHVAGDPVGANGFKFVGRWDARPITKDTYGVNKLGVIASNSGTKFDLYLNENFVDSVAFQGVSSAQGKVGLSLSGRAVQVAFDNFSYSPR